MNDSTKLDLIAMAMTLMSAGGAVGALLMFSFFFFGEQFNFGLALLGLCGIITNLWMLYYSANWLRDNAGAFAQKIIKAGITASVFVAIGSVINHFANKFVYCNYGCVTIESHLCSFLHALGPIVALMGVGIAAFVFFKGEADD